MGKQASGESRSTLYAVKAIWDLGKRKIEPKAEFLWLDKVVKMEIADRTVFFMLMGIGTKLFWRFFCLVVMVFKNIMCMAKGMKRLVGNSELH